MADAEFVDQQVADLDTGATHDPSDPVGEPQKKRKNAPIANDASKKPKIQENRAVYITNLPPDTTEDELEGVFKKYGMIDQGVGGNKRIKMYKDDDGNFTGEALIVYFKKESVNLAIMMLDDYEFRMGDRSNGNIHVQEADMSYKKHKDGDEIATKMVRKDKKASERNRAEMNRKLAEWSDNEEEVKETYAPKKNKWAKVAIVKHAFTLEELEEDDSAILDIKDDMREEAEKFGDVTKVVLFDKEPDGILTVRFREFQSAEDFKAANNGRWFDKRKLDVTIADDRPKFKKSAKGNEEDSEDETERLERFIEKD